MVDYTESYDDFGGMILRIIQDSTLACACGQLVGKILHVPLTLTPKP